MIDNTKEVALSLTELAHDIFSNLIYKGWRDNLNIQDRDRWFSLIVELDKSGCSVEVFKDFSSDIKSNLVYRCMPAPNYKRSGEVMILFNVSGWTWHSLINFKQNDK